MNPQDNPEDRIRQLEQSAAGYGAVELGGQQQAGADAMAQLPPPVYGSPPNYGSPNYGNANYGTPPPNFGASTPPNYGSDPYGAPPFGVSFPQGPKKGAPVGLIFGIIAVFVVVLFSGIGFAVWNATSRTTEILHNLPSATGSGGTVGRSTPGRTASPPTATVVIPSSPSVSKSPAGAPISISGIEENKTVECDNNEVSISGVSNTVTITGHCKSVSVSGMSNHVTVESTDTIGASGFDNQVTYQSGDPQVDNSGGNNSVQRG